MSSKILKESRYITSWQFAMNRIIIGIALSIFVLNIWYLGYILPTLGIVIMFLGFRVISNENVWLKAGLYLTAVRLLISISILISNATIFNCTSDNLMRVQHVFDIIIPVLNLVLLVCFWRGIRSVCNKIDIPLNCASIVALIIWYIILCLLAALQYSGVIIFAGIVISFVFIIIKIFSLCCDIEESGFHISTVPSRLSDIFVIAGIILVIGVGMSCGYIFFGDYSMDWETAKISDDDKVAEIKKDLVGIGFPENILNDLSDEDIKACEGALYVEVQEGDYAADDGKLIYNPVEGQNYIENGEKILHITGIGVQLPGENSEWKIFHHFLWKSNPEFYGMESIIIQCTKGNYRVSDFREVTGHLLYEMENKTFVSPYYSLGYETYNNTFLGKWQGETSDLTAEFSMPKEGEKHRGYVSYSICDVDAGMVINSNMNYYHQKKRYQYPVMTAPDRLKNNMMDKDVFFMIQSMFLY